jgi:hypothetical protein
MAETTVKNFYPAGFNALFDLFTDSASYMHVTFRRVPYIGKRNL